MYNVHARKYLWALLPPQLRTDRHLDWLMALIKPVRQLYWFFKSYMADTNYHLTFTGQVASLEQLLNDKFPQAQGQIAITDYLPAVSNGFVYYRSEGQSNGFVYYRSEGQGNGFVYYRSELQGSYDFVIWVPQAWLPLTPAIEAAISAWVDRYRIAGVRYLIQNF